MATQSTYTIAAARRGSGSDVVPMRRAADRLSWDISALFILGVSLVCWGLLALAFNALIA